MAEAATPFERVHPERAGIPPWNLSPRDLARWLLLSVTGHLEEGLGLKAYGQAARFVVRGDDLAEGLALLAEARDATGLALFREACALAVEQLDFSNPDSATLLDTLMLLARNITATSTLDVLARKIDPVAPDDWPLDVYQSALELAFRFADKDGKRAAILLRHLIAARRRFPVLQVGLALEALARAEPDALVDHWLLLQDPLERKYGPADERAEQERRTRRAALLTRVAKPIADKAKLLLGEPARDGTLVAAPAWWLDTIVASRDPEIARIARRPPEFTVVTTVHRTPPALWRPPPRHPSMPRPSWRRGRVAAQAGTLSISLVLEIARLRLPDELEFA